MYLGSNKVKRIYLGKCKIKKVYLGSNKVWSGASEVTYIYGGQSVVEEVEEGENCAIKTVTITGATFLGWTTDPTSTTPISNIPATGEPMTLYAIWTKSVSISLGDSNFTHSSRTYTKGVTTNSAFNVRVYGTIYSYAGNQDERTTVTVFLNEKNIGECYTHNKGTSLYINHTATGILNAVTIKCTIRPHGSEDEGYGNFNGTCAYTGIG